MFIKSNVDYAMNLTVVVARRGSISPHENKKTLSQFYH